MNSTKNGFLIKESLGDALRIPTKYFASKYGATENTFSATAQGVLFLLTFNQKHISEEARQLLNGENIADNFVSITF